MSSASDTQVVHADGPQGPIAPASKDGAARHSSKSEAPLHSEAGVLWVERVEGTSALRDRLADWDDLVRHAAHPNAFYEPSMLLSALEHYGSTNVEIVLVYAPHPTAKRGQAVLCGLMPICRKRSKVALGTEILELWQYPLAYLCTPLLRQKYVTQAWGCFVDWVAATGKGSFLVKCDNVHDEGPFGQTMVDTLSERGWPYSVVDRLTRAAFVRTSDLPTAEAYLAAALPGKRRKELRRQRSRLGEQAGGPLVMECLSPGASADDVRRAGEAFLALEQKGWKGEAQTAMSCRAEDRAFFLATLAETHRRGRLMMLTLRLGDTPIAMKCNLLSPPGSFAFRITYDESHAAFSPGVLLELDNLAQLFVRPDIAFMDSCASRNRVMINRLWLSRQRMQTVVFSTGSPGRAFLLAMQPLFGWGKRVAAGSK